MDAIINPIKKFFDQDYIYGVEIIVILGIVVFLLYVFYCLGIIKTPEK
jgi:hypothetical protein